MSRSSTDRPPGDDLRSLGAFLRSMRASLSLTQDQLAAKTLSLRWPVSRATISALEQGKHSPTATTVVSIARALHLSPMEVIDRLEIAGSTRRDPLPVDPERLDARFQECFANREFHESLEILDVLLERAQREPTTDRDAGVRRLVGLIMRRARTLERLGAVVAAKAAAEQALAHSIDLPEQQTEAYLVLVGVYRRLRNLPLAWDAADRAVARSTEAGAPLRIRAWIEQGRALSQGGRFEDARRAFVAGRELAAAAGHPVMALECEGGAGRCLLELGRLREARIRMLHCLDAARRHQLPALEARWLVELGRIALRAGRVAEAQRRADAALRLARQREEWPVVFAATMLRHRVARRTEPGDSDRRRVAYLKKLLGRIEDHDDDDIEAFRRELTSERQAEIAR